MFWDELSRAVDELLGRAGGPLRIRLLIQPTIAITLAILAGLRDVRENKPPFLWEFVRNAGQRRALIKKVWKDLGRLLVAAFIIDSLYQLIALTTFHLLQTLIVTFALALLPYIILRGLVTRIRLKFRP